MKSSQNCIAFPTEGTDLMRHFSFMLALSTTTGCASISPDELVPPGEVTVENAITDVARGLAMFNRINKRSNINSGLLVDELEVELKLAASAADSSKLVVDLSRTSSGGSSSSEASANAEAGAESDASVDNTVKIKFKNLYTAALNDAGKSAATTIDPGDVTLFSIPGNTGIPDQGSITTFGTPNNSYLRLDCSHPVNDAARTACLLMAR